jgi:hypothetical protein
MVSDPADYRWSSYGEAVGGGKKGNGKKAWEGLVRACMSHKGISFEAEKWKEVSRIYRRAMGMALGRKSGWAVVGVSGHATKNEEEMLSSNDNETVLGSWDGGDVDETGEIFHGRCGDREQRVCERGVRGGAGEVHGEEEGWRAEDAGQRRGGEGGAVEHPGSAGRGMKKTSGSVHSDLGWMLVHTGDMVGIIRRFFLSCDCRGNGSRP